MPGFDGTGPQGRGPMTGGGRGYCAVGWNGAPRRGYGLGWGTSRTAYGGGRRWSGAPAYGGAPMPDIDALVDKIERLSERVEALASRLDARERGNR